jgi:hypothetical protein
MGFNDMKSASKSMYKTLASEMEKMAKKSESYKDDRLWRAETDKTGNGYAVIRFLPPVDGEDVPWARVWHHGFRGQGGWYIENSLTTIGLKDPVSEMNSLLWNSGSDKDKALARDRKRKLSYISNILVISDPKNPENEGKVFLFKYGKKIFEKIQEAMNPQYQDETPINPFDFWNGADFKLKIRQVDGYTNYDKSEFASPSPLMGGSDKELEKIWSKQYPLKEFTDPKSFKSYDELKARLQQVLGDDIRAVFTESGSGIKGGAEAAMDTDEDEQPARLPKRSPAPEVKKTAVRVDDDADTEDALSYFEKLADEE